MALLTAPLPQEMVQVGMLKEGGVEYREVACFADRSSIVMC